MHNASLEPWSGESDLRLHPAAAAWLNLDSAHLVPDRISPLFADNKKKKKPKSAVFKLEGALAGSSAVIAKQCRRETARLEHLIYEKILPKLQIPRLRYYGYLEHESLHWLFIEFAEGVPWEVKNSSHQDIAAKWLATIHYNSSLVGELTLVREKGAEHYLSQLSEVELRAREAAAASGLNYGESCIFEEVQHSLALLNSHWSQIASFCSSMPVCLGHNDFIDKNIQVRDDGNDLVLLPYDWEMCGRGTQATDLYWILENGGGAKTLELYRNYYSNYGGKADRSDIQHIARLGVIFRYLDALEWVSYGFGYETEAGRERSIQSAKIYLGRLSATSQILGWK